MIGKGFNIERIPEFILGLGGHAKVVLSSLYNPGVISFVDIYGYHNPNDKFMDRPVVDLSSVSEGNRIYLGIGDNKKRYEKYQELSGIYIPSSLSL